MPNRIYDSYINPVDFHDLQPVRADQYCSRFMRDWHFRRTIQPWDERVCFYQPWYQNDSIRLQYLTNYLPLTIEVYNEEGVLMLSQPCLTLHQDELRPTFYIRQFDINCAFFPPGKYFMRRVSPGSAPYSEPFEIHPIPDQNLVYLEEDDPTIYIEYSHPVAYQGLYFFAPFSPTIRVPAIIAYEDTGSVDTIYIDQRRNVKNVNSEPYTISRFFMAGRRGMPPAFEDKIKRIFGCSSLKADGLFIVKNEGAKWDQVKLQNYPMAGSSIEIVEMLNRDSHIIDNDVEIVGVAAAALLLNSKGFGMNDGGNNYIEIESLE